MGVSLSLDKRSAVLRYGLLVIVLILWYSLVWEPLSGRLEDADTRIEAQRIKIESLKRDIRRHYGVDSRLKQSRQELAQAIKRLIAGNAPQLVASNLQDILLKKASEAGLEVVTYKTARVRKWRGHQLALATFTAKADTRKLVKFLKLLDDDDRLFRISRIDVVKIISRHPYLRISIEAEALFMKG